MSFEPKIAGVLCNWCSYAGADLAGTSRKKYTPNIRVVRVMCSGPGRPHLLILKAFQKVTDISRFSEECTPEVAEAIPVCVEMILQDLKDNSITQPVMELAPVITG